MACEKEKEKIRFRNVSNESLSAAGSSALWKIENRPDENVRPAVLSAVEITALEKRFDVKPRPVRPYTVTPRSPTLYTDHAVESARREDALPRQYINHVVVGGKTRALRTAVRGPRGPTGLRFRF